MKDTLTTILKVFFIISAILLLLLFVYGLTLLLDWPWWMAFFLLVGIIGLIIGGVLLKKIWLNRREQRFVEQIVSQEPSMVTEETGVSSADLSLRFKEAVAELKSSHLKNVGNPLYVLPWYMIIGESGSGKTTAINSAGLSSPFAGANKASGFSGTRNCDWWFFENAVILDTAGRYAVHVNQGKDKAEWETFLVNLAKYRKKEPINGLVITIAADKLLTSTPAIIEEEGITIRKRVDELMQVLGAKFPIYLLISKCDLIQGMTQFCNHIPEETLKQAMGRVNPDYTADAVDFVHKVMDRIGERLRELRLIFSHTPAAAGKDRRVDPSLLLFPEEFERLKPGLDAFVKSAFKTNPYQETPLLRGVYFSSGRQEGTPFSHFLKSLNLIKEKEVLPGTSKGLFLHDLFAKIMPRDRKLFAPTQKALELDRLTKNLGLACFIAVAIAVCGLLSYSFIKNLRTMRNISHEFAQTLILKGDILEDVITLDRFHQAIIETEKQNKSWWVPRLGLNESNHVEAVLKEKFCKQFRDGFLTSFDQNITDAMTRFSLSTPSSMTSAYVPHVVRRINLLKARIEKQKPEELFAMPQPSWELVENMSHKQFVSEVKEKLANLYVHYLIWQPSSDGFNKEMNALQALLKHVETQRYATLNWIIDWINADPDLDRYTLENFWGGSREVPDDTAVLPAFTISGKKQIDAFIAEMDAALFDPLIIAGLKDSFYKSYIKTYASAWYEFGMVFPKGANRLKGKDEWTKTANAVVSFKGPYLSVLDKMVQELKPLKQGKNSPEWIRFVFLFNDIRMRAEKMASLGNKKTLRNIAEKGENLLAKLDNKDQEHENTEAMYLAADALGRFRVELEKTAPITLSVNSAFEMTSQAYKDDPADTESPFLLGHQALRNLRTAMGDVSEEQKMFWSLVDGPFNLIWAYARTQTACQLQKIWEKDVLFNVPDGVEPAKLAQEFMGKGGAARVFIDETAGPFISRSRRGGYFPKEVLKRKIQFTEAFFNYATKGAKASLPTQDNYSVTIKGLPTDVNRDARIRPHATILSLQCDDNTQTMMNLQFPIRKTFEWSPSNCGNVTFKIEIGDMVLTKEYTGFRAFAKFLKDFSKGSRMFYAKEFNSQSSALKRFGIKYIKVKYELKGHHPVIRLLTDSPGMVPEEIVTCWE